MSRIPQPITIVFADEHLICRTGFCAMFKNETKVEVMATATDGNELLDAVRKHQPHIVVTDIKLSDLDGIEATKMIKAEFPEMKVIGFSIFDDESIIKDMGEAGSNGYLLKSASKQQLLDAFEKVLAGEKYFCKETAKILTHRFTRTMLKPRNGYGLTKMQIKVMKMVIDEKTTNEIAQELNISPKTVENHRYRLHKKIGVNSSIGLVRYAAKNGYL